MPSRQSRLAFAKHFERAQGWLLLDKYVEAVAALEEIPAAYQTRTEVLLVRGHAHQSAKQWVQAEDTFRQLLAIDDTDAQHWISLAYAVRRSKSIKDAEPILRDARLKFPAVALISFNLACYAAQEGRIEEAKLLLSEALHLEPDLRAIAQTDPDLSPLRSSKN
jgi:Flp pilus assembly protein TadD